MREVVFFAGRKRLLPVLKVSLLGIKVNKNAEGLSEAFRCISTKILYQSRQQKRVSPDAVRGEKPVQGLLSDDFVLFGWVCLSCLFLAFVVGILIFWWCVFVNFCATLR